MIAMKKLPCLLLLAVALASGCSGSDDGELALFETPKTAVAYSVEMTGLPSEEMTETAENALAVYREQEAGAQSLAFLKRRAQGDAAMVKRILRSGGYYSGKVDVTVAEVAAAEAEGGEDAATTSGDTAQDDAGDAPKKQAVVTIEVTPGPAFTLSEHQFKIAEGSARAPDAAALGSPVGEPPAAAAIVNAETAAVTQLQRAGYPYAQRLKRRAVADLEAATLAVTTPLASGPASAFGDVTFEGLEDVRARYLRTYLPWETGDIIDTNQLRSYQRALLATDLFDTVSVKLPEDAPEGAEPVLLPVTVTAEERPFRTASAGVRYSTDNGPSVSGGLEHRNLFGENETLSTEAEVGLEEQRIAFGYREPQYLRAGQDLLGGLVLLREEDDAFDQLSATATLGLQRRLSAEWVVGAGVLGEASLITDQGVETTAFLGGLPVFAEYDDTDDLLNPTSGTWFRGELTPFAGIFDDEFAGFLKVDTTASGYVKLLSDDRYVFAGRGRFATIVAEDIDKVPQTRRLYSGGGGSVRGFAQRFVGELDSNNDPIGGLSALELGAELRAKVYGDIGGVLFVDAGSVSAETFPAFDNGVQFATGFGFRYYSPVGPIRFDVAFPLNKRDADDAFQFYFSIGQAF